ncbi:YihY/virulence factor BrkB family protein [Parahaliea mediterranea]|uniref:YihY/virulence factor BrkB family protein n=1 Tax=Parahaliea mediterranea TaxID=651086 RepID=A0A939DE33_9GAMM|nr:YihY/virulence factor BrkB family protein [Parahaliea mediterranea]MBN7796483.1 YihY/virulence factor BrkB family protein [Parahaliea mediterranea]
MYDKLIHHLKYWSGIFRQAADFWLKSHAFANAGSLAFFTLFSIAPVMIVIVSVIGVFYGQEAAEGQLVLQLQETIGPEAAEAVQTAVASSSLKGGGLMATIGGIAAMLIGATTVFGQMQHSLNEIWAVVPKPSRNSLFLLLRKRLTSLTIVLAVGFVMLVSLSLSVGLRLLIQHFQGWLPWYDVAFSALDLLLSLLVVSLLFGTIFKVLPDVELSWRDVALGSILTAVLFSIGRSLIALYLSYTATASTYGAAGSLVLLLLWVNYSSLILLYGAAFIRAHLRARGRVIQPKSVAVRVRQEIIEEPPTERPTNEGH